jgi:hypothetical protein
MREAEYNRLHDIIVSAKSIKEAIDSIDKEFCIKIIPYFEKRDDSCFGMSGRKE